MTTLRTTTLACWTRFAGVALRIINIHEAKTHLSRLVDEVEAGEPFIIAKAGRPVARVVPLEPPAAGAQRRVGFLAGHVEAPDDFDAMGAEVVRGLFEGAG